MHFLVGVVQDVPEAFDNLWQKAGNLFGRTVSHRAECFNRRQLRTPVLNRFEVLKESWKSLFDCVVTELKHDLLQRGLSGLANVLFLVRYTSQDIREYFWQEELK